MRSEGHPLRVAEFFSGIGGFTLALESAGAEVVYSCEIDDFCREVFKARFGHEPQAKDINEVKPDDIPDADLWVAGWPCQGLSVAGLRKGLADDRSGLFWQFVRLLEQKRPPGLLAENVPGLLTTCSCPRCGRQCKDCCAPAGGDDEACQLCGSERLGGRVLPDHRGTDFFVVLSALQRIGYGVQTRILDAQHLGVPQRRRRVFFVGHLGAPCRPEILFEPQGGSRDSEARGEEGKIAAGELARSLGAVGGGNDYGANKGTLVLPKTAHALSFGTKPGFSDRGDGCDNLVEGPEGPQVASAGHHGHSSPRGDGTDNLVASTVQPSPKADRGQPRENLVAGTLQSCGPGQGRKTPEVDHLVAPAMDGPAHAMSKGTGGGLGGREGQDDYVIVGSLNAHSKRHGHQMNSGQAGEEGHVIAVPAAPTAFHRNASCNVADQKGKAAALKAEGEHSYQFLGIPVPDNLPTVTPDTGGKSKGWAPITEAQSRVVAPLDTQHAHGGVERAAGGHLVQVPEARAVVQQPLFIDAWATHGCSAPNQNPVKKDGKSDCLGATGPGAVALQEDGQNGATVRKNAGTLRAAAPGHQPGGSLVAFNPQAAGCQDRLNVSAKGTDALSSSQKPAIAFQPRYYGDREEAGGAPSPTVDITNAKKAGDSAPHVFAFAERTRDGEKNVEVMEGGKTPALLNPGAGGRSDAVRVCAPVAPPMDGTSSRTGNERTETERMVVEERAATMMVRRLTVTECTRLQGFPDGWVCVCGVRPDCPDRRIPPWVDPSTFTLGGCGHSTCGCRCPDSPGYRALGNTIAVPVVRWIAERLLRQKAR